MAELPDVEQYNRDITEALISHPGWDEFLKLAEKEVRRLKAALMNDSHPDMETLALATAAHRGGLAALLLILKAPYVQAKIEAPESLKQIFR